jgi:hypothetical protein
MRALVLNGLAVASCLIAIALTIKGWPGRDMYYLGLAAAAAASTPGMAMLGKWLVA